MLTNFVYTSHQVPRGPNSAPPYSEWHGPVLRAFLSLHIALIRLRQLPVSCESVPAT